MEACLDAAEIARRRMRSVGLTGPRMPGYAEVIRRLGAVQAQDYGPAKWSLAQRIGPNSTLAQDSALEQAFSEGRVIRTHVLRPTWHFVLPEDLRWMLELTAPRVHALNGYYYRQLELDNVLHRRFENLLATELRGENYLTRKEIGIILARSGIEAAALRLGYLLIHAELDGLICSGPRRGRQQTYALTDERVPTTPVMDRESALAELTRRYFTGHGPATIKDFRWWSSLSTPDIVAGIDAVGDDLITESLDGTSYWFADPSRDGSGRNPVGRESAGRESAGRESAGRESVGWESIGRDRRGRGGGEPGAGESDGGESDRGESDDPDRSPTVYLIQSYDEYVVGYTESKYVLDISGAARSRPGGRTIFNQVILLDSQVAGYWRPTPKRGAVLIEAVLDCPFDSAQHRALRAAADEYAEFLGLTAELAIA